MSTESMPGYGPVPEALGPLRIPSDPEANSRDESWADPRARAWLEVRASALRANFRRVRAAVGPGVGIIPMVKANAYGLGIAGAVRTLREEAPLGWGVATVDEGLRLVELGVSEPIRIFSPVPPGDLARAWRAGLRPSLSDLSCLEGIPAGLAGTFDVEVDTGMGRSGFDAREVGHWAPALLARSVGEGHPDATGDSPGLLWTGLFTHLHSADDPDPAAALATVKEQMDRFQAVLAAVDRYADEAGHPRLQRHVANSAGALRFADRMAAFDAVRPGIAIYGGSVGSGQGLQETVAVRARVTRVTSVPAGTTLGYASTYRSRGPERWATLGIGYGDGLPRALSNRGFALVAGRRVPIIGRISMDMTVVDVTDVAHVRPGDVATLVGTDGGETIPLAEVAEHARTIDYEVLTGWTPRLPRIWLHASPGGRAGEMAEGEDE